MFVYLLAYASQKSHFPDFSAWTEDRFAASPTPAGVTTCAIGASPSTMYLKDPDWDTTIGLHAPNQHPTRTVTGQGTPPRRVPAWS